MSPAQPVTVVIPTLDEADRLAACLESVRWAAQVIVVDCGSRDATREIARRLGAEVVERPFACFGDQRNHGATLAHHDWILCVDADERVPAELQLAIQEVLANPRHVAYWIGRETMIAGRVIRHCGWQRDRVLRLYDRRHAAWNRRLVHETLELRAPAGELRPVLRHETYRDLPRFAAKTARYAELGARALHLDGRRAGVAALLLLPVARFLKMYVVERGFLDGVPGLIVCGLAAHGVFLKYARLWEARARPPDDREPGARATALDGRSEPGSTQGERPCP